MRPAKGNANSARTRPPRTAGQPPSRPSASRRLTATAMSSSVVPTTQRLWLSWPTGRSTERPLREKPKPWTNPRPILPLRPWRSSTQILSRSCSGSACRRPSRNGRLASKRRVRILPGMMPMTAVAGPGGRHARNDLRCDRQRTEQGVSATRLGQHPPCERVGSHRTAAAKNGVHSAAL